MSKPIETSIDHLQKLLSHDCKVLLLSNISGRIMELSISYLGCQVKVRYVDSDDIITEEWFYIDELEY